MSQAPTERDEGLADDSVRERPAKHPTLDDKYFVPVDELLAAFAGVPPIDYERLRADIDVFVDQDPTPRDWPTY